MNPAEHNTPCARCGHPPAAHYNARSRRAERAPCHHLGRHDTRCACRDYEPTTNAARCLECRGIIADFDRSCYSGTLGRFCCAACRDEYLENERNPT